MSAPPKPAARIISHMNKDHSDSVVRYLEHYHSVPAVLASFASLKEITVSHMTIKALGNRYIVPFDPPMKDLSEARARVVAMDKECIKALGRDEITLKKYIAPRGFQLAVFVTCLFTYLLLGRRETLAPSSDSLLRPLADKYPAVFEWLWKIQPKVFYPMIAIHITEASIMGFGPLRKHSVPLLSPLWLQWTASCFIEGVGSFMRIRDMVKEEKAKREKAQH